MMVLFWMLAVALTSQSFERALDEGIRRYWNGEYEATIDVLQTACAMNADSGEKLECHKYLAFSHVALGDDTEATDEFIALLSTDAGYRLDESLVSPKIVSRFETARQDLASKVYDSAKDFYQQEQFADAIELFERAAVLNPSHELAKEYVELCRERVRLNEAASSAPATPPSPAAEEPAPRPAPDREEKVYWLTSEISRPVLVKRVAPRYPETARLRRSQGSVVVSVVINKDGRITEAKVVRSVSDQLDRAALEAVVQWEYEPAIMDGLPVAVYGIVELSFTLAGS